MRGFFYSLTTVAALLATVAVSAQNKAEKLDSVVVSASRAGKATPVTYTMVGKEELSSASPSKSLVEVLSSQPSVVTYNEGGTGLGNSAITVRGSKGSQINVTLNGVTLNDAESQEVFWVNIPSLPGLLSSVQLQRGLGTSASGAGAFGASINMSTASASPEPFVNFDLSAGSWNTFISTVSAGSGISKSGFYTNIAYSKGYTDGYIRNGFVDSQSLFAVAGWISEKNSLRLTYLMGGQKSGITWDGIDPEKYKTDRRYNGAGEYYDEFGNVYYYDDQTDNYSQHHVQLGFTHVFGDRLTWVNTLNYTRGDGYDEYYKTGRKFGSFGFPSAMKGLDGETYKKSDMIYQKICDNDLYVYLTDLRYRAEKLDLTAGLSLSRHLGGHWGDVLWAKVLGDSYDYGTYKNNDSNPWYSYKGKKLDASAFVRAEYMPADGLTLYGDLQLRRVSYDIWGRDDDYADKGDAMDYSNSWTFFNPRAGVTYVFGDAHKVYASAALGHREPGRSDIKENIKGELSPIKPESMVDIEAGYEFRTDKFEAAANVYLMEYKDMLLETGKLSSSGYAIKENVDRSWRRGVELSALWRPVSQFALSANAAFSTNKIEDYTAYYEDWENGGMVAVDCGQTTMLMSPSVTAAGKLTFRPFANASGSVSSWKLELVGKYVGKQYWDSTESEDRSIPAFFVSDLSVSREFNVGNGKLGLHGYIGNLLNREYYAYAWVYRAYQGGSDPWYQEAGIYPQATRNFTLKLSYSF